MKTRKKNALTGYFVAVKPAAGGDVEEWLELAKWITSVTDASEDQTEDVGYYDGDGSQETDVTGRKEAYDFEGTFDKHDPAMAFIHSLKRETGEGRKIMFKVVEPDGETVTGPATVSGPITSGGEATAYPAFNCNISFDRKPVVTTTPQVATTTP